MRTKIFLTLLALVILALYSSWGRPLWLDEYLHFVFGGFASAGDAWDAVRSSVTNINHGQTGFYIMIDFGLLKAFGANLFMMRLPSLLSGALLLFSSALFLRRKGLGAVAIAAAFLMLAAQPNLMYFIGEARPYMPMAAAAVACLAYFSSDYEQRSTSAMRVFIWGSVTWGALMMPYFLIYLPVIALSCFVIQARSRSIGEFITFVNVPLQLTSLALGLGIGVFTWLGPSPNFQRDPWLILRPLVDSLTVVHVLGALGVLALMVLTVGLGRSNPVGPLILIAAMTVIALLLLVLSFSQNYWILPRQFIASQAIITLAAVWGIGQALRSVPNAPRLGLSIIYALLITVAFARAAVQQAENLSDWENNGFPVAGKPGDAQLHGIDVGPANQNVIQGGPVWAGLTEIYSTPRFAEGEGPPGP